MVAWKHMRFISHFRAVSARKLMRKIFAPARPFFGHAQPVRHVFLALPQILSPYCDAIQAADDDLQRNGRQYGRHARALCPDRGLAQDTEPRRRGPCTARGGGNLPPPGHHLRGLWRQPGLRTPDPLRHHSARLRRRRMAQAFRRHRAAGAGAQCLHPRSLPPPGNPAGGPHPP